MGMFQHHRGLAYVWFERIEKEGIAEQDGVQKDGPEKDDQDEDGPQKDGPHIKDGPQNKDAMEAPVAAIDDDES